MSGSSPGAMTTLREMDCLLVIETHSLELERDCIATLKDLGYQTRIIDHGWYRASSRSIA